MSYILRWAKKMIYLNLSRMLKIGTALFLVLCSISSYAQDALADIAKHQERIERLENEFVASKRRILVSAGISSTQTYDQLDSVSNFLSSVSREFEGLARSIMLATLVTDKRAIPHARTIVETQKDFMARRFQIATDFTEKTLLRAADPETKRLLLEARDIFNASTELVTRLKTSGSKEGGSR